MMRQGNHTPRGGLLSIFLFTLLLMACEKVNMPVKENTSDLNYGSGGLEVHLSLGPIPENAAGFLDFELTVTTRGTEPILDIPDFTAGGFELKSWQELPSMAVEDRSTYRYKCRLEPLQSGELYLLPIRINSGETISDMVTTEGIMIKIPSLFSDEEKEAVARGQLPESRPLRVEPQPWSVVPVIIPALIIATGLILIFILVQKKKKRKIPELTAGEKAIRDTEKLNPAHYPEFYAQAAGIIRVWEKEDGKEASELGEILKYYELAAYTGRLSEKSGLPPRNPGEDKAKMMIFFSRTYEEAER
ncbi:MAG: hypothetical protein JEY99_06210 [Spirochaetales bacterium]|nr:hypothetical protein [Spirochaetales bacterium]